MMKPWHRKNLGAGRTPRGAKGQPSRVHPLLGGALPQAIAAAAVVFAGLTWWDARENGKIATAQTDAAQRLARAADRQAQLAARQLEVNRTLARAAEAQANAQLSQARTAALLVEVERNAGAVQADMADATASVQRPRLGLTAFNVGALGMPPDPAEGRELQVTWQFTNVGGSALTILEDRWQVIIRAGPFPPFKWADVAPTSTTDVNVAVGYGYGPVQPMKIKLTAAQSAELRADRLAVFLVDIVRYRDSRGQDLTQCFLIKGRNVAGEIASAYSVPNAPPCATGASRLARQRHVAGSRLLVGSDF